LINGCLPPGDVTGDLTKQFNCALTNTYFVGPNATPLAYNPGNVSAGFFANGGTPNTIVGNEEVQGVPQVTQTGFALGTFNALFWGRVVEWEFARRERLALAPIFGIAPIPALIERLRIRTRRSA